MKKRLIYSLFFLLLFAAGYAQKEPMKYGKVDKSDLEMKVYPADSSAAAVVLCNYGYFDSNRLQFVHQMRIKILKEEGKDRGSFSVPAGEKTNVKGQTVNLEKGVPVVTKLDRSGIFIERITRNYYQARVAFPNVKVGSVIDVEFYFQGLPSYWSFQETIPVKWSELILEENSYFSFKKNFTGYIPMAEASSDRWVAKDVPAFKTEPYVNNITNYLSRMNIEISSVHIPGYLYEDFSTSWADVAKKLMKDDNFGGLLSQISLFPNTLAKDIKNTSSSPEEKMSKAYEAIRKIKWNNDESVWASNTGLSYAFNKQIGNTADINLNLILLLRKLDIDANPLVLSTRDNGQIPPFSVSLQRLNYVIAHVAIGDKTYLLDATDENLALGDVPERTINGKGLLVRKDDSFEWIDLTPRKKNKQISILNLKFTPDGRLKGDWSKSYFDYAALRHRISYKKYNSQDEYLKSLESKYNGLSIDNFSMANLDSLQLPVKEEYTVTLKNKITKTNNQIFVQPVLFDSYSENPLKAAERVYPVDFTTATEKTFIFYLEIPEGYAVEQLPKNIKMTLPQSTASLQMMSSLNENKVQVLFKLLINKPVFYQPEYPDLKAFFDELVKKEAEMLILKKV